MPFDLDIRDADFRRNNQPAAEGRKETTMTEPNSVLPREGESCAEYMIRVGGFALTDPTPEERAMVAAINAREQLAWEREQRERERDRQ